MILISACLLGCACRYDGKSKPHPLAQELLKKRQIRRYERRYNKLRIIPAELLCSVDVNSTLEHLSKSLMQGL